MYKKFILLVAFLGVSFVALAQDSQSFKKNEVSFSVGSFLGLIDNKKISPSVSLSYFRRFNRIWSVGVTVSYVHFKSDDMCLMTLPSGEIVNYPYTNTDKYLSLLFTGKASWARMKRCNFYSSFSWGPTNDFCSTTLDEDFATVTEDGVLAIQLTPIGFEIGNDNIRGFAELGFGLQGFVNIGIAHRF